MAKDRLTLDEIHTALTELGDTGNVRIHHGGLYTQEHDKSDWLYIGGVEDATAAEDYIEAYFLRANER